MTNIITSVSSRPIWSKRSFRSDSRIPCNVLLWSVCHGDGKFEKSDRKFLWIWSCWWKNLGPKKYSWPGSALVQMCTVWKSIAWEFRPKSGISVFGSLHFPEISLFGHENFFRPRFFGEVNGIWTDFAFSQPIFLSPWQNARRKIVFESCPLCLGCRWHWTSERIVGSVESWKSILILPGDLRKACESQYNRGLANWAVWLSNLRCKFWADVKKTALQHRSPELTLCRPLWLSDASPRTKLDDFRSSWP